MDFLSASLQSKKIYKFIAIARRIIQALIWDNIRTLEANWIKRSK